MGVVDETHVMIKKDYMEEVGDLLQTEVSCQTECHYAVADLPSLRRTRIFRTRICNPCQGSANFVQYQKQKQSQGKRCPDRMHRTHTMLNPRRQMIPNYSLLLMLIYICLFI